MTKTVSKSVLGDSESVLISTLKPYPGNPRKGDVDSIRASLRANGQYRPLVVRTKTREVLAGNHTLLAAKAEGWEHVGVSWVDCDDETAKRIVLVDNRTNDKAGYDEDALAELLAQLESFEGTGYSQADYDSLVKAMEPESGAEQLGEVLYQIVIECDSEDHQAELLEQFATEGLRTRAIAI